MPTEYLNTSATSLQSWVCPAGVTSIDIECIGRGALSGAISAAAPYGGGGGGGGAYAKKTAFAVTPGTTYYWWAPNAHSNSLTGQSVAGSVFQTSSTVNTGVVCLAPSATNVGTNTQSGGAGASIASAVGDVLYAGGTGGNGSSATSGGGGSAGLSNATGNSGSGATPGSGSGDSGSGAAGISATRRGTAGNNYGGGSGGSFRAVGAGVVNGSFPGGGIGVVKLTYTVVIPGVILSSGELQFKAAVDGSDAKVYLDSAGGLKARTSPASGDRLLTLSAGQVVAGSPAP